MSGERGALARSKPLLVEDLGNLAIGVGRCQFTDAVNDRWVGAMLFIEWLATRDFQFCERLGLPTNTDVDGSFPPSEGDILDQKAQELLALSVRRGRCVPDGGQVLGKPTKYAVRDGRF